MPNVGIIADTTASIPERIVQDLHIELVPYYVIREGENLRDSFDVKPEPFADYLARADVLPTTSCPSPGDYLAAFKKLAEHTCEIVAITMTSKGSGAYTSAQAAVQILRERMPDVNVQVVDTLQVAMSYGWAVIEAARGALEGLSQNQVIERARQVAEKGMMVQTADTLRYLYMGGRIGRATHLVGSLLNIKPLIGMENGTIVALGVARGRPKAYQRMAELAAERFGEGAAIRIAFTHCAALDQLEMLKEQMLKRFDCVEVIVTSLSPALAVHSGPGTVGMCFTPVSPARRRDG